MVFRAAFDCLWCGRPHEVRSPIDLEGWAQLCPECVGRAGDNGFLRARLRAALAERAGAAPGAPEPTIEREPTIAPEPAAEMLAYYEARAPEYDDWYLRRGRYSRGPVHDLAWQADLDAATLWLDRQPFGGEIVELAAGTGWWSTLLAGKGTLWLYDANDAPLELARRRLVAHGLRAHIHTRDAWAEPERAVDGLFAGFWLSHVPRERLDDFLALAHRWLRPGGTFAFIDSRPDPQSGATDQAVAPGDEVQVRRLADGREFRVTKVYREPPELEAALSRAGFSGVNVTTTSRFFVLGSAAA